MAVYGYARVSTDGQSLSAQLAELKAAKCEKIHGENTAPNLLPGSILFRFHPPSFKATSNDKKCCPVNLVMTTRTQPASLLTGPHGR